jgi:hypothetical protein
MNFASTIQIARSSSIRLSPERQRSNAEIAAVSDGVDQNAAFKFGDFALDALRADLIKENSITPATFQRTFGEIELRWDRRFTRS